MVRVDITDKIKKITDCKKNFSCLSDQTRQVCKISYCIEDMYYFIEQSTHNDCGYKMNYGYANMCRCPVRKELYKKYSI